MLHVLHVLHVLQGRVASTSLSPRPTGRDQPAPIIEEQSHPDERPGCTRW
ncbi:MAG: hypothetical protein ACOCZK_02260 [Planctomycetota bacterium]